MSSPYHLQILLEAQFKLLLCSVLAIIIALYLFDQLLHFFHLPFPLFRAHLALPPEEFLVWLSVAASQTIPERGVLSIVVVEVEVVHCVARSTVQDWAVGNVFSIMDEDGPDLNEDEEAEVGELLEREEEREDVVWDTLEEAVNRVEGNGSVGCRHDPFVVGLMKCLVDKRVVETAVDEVYEAICEENEEWELEPVVVFEWFIREGIVELGVSMDFSEEEWDGEKRHARHGSAGLLDFHADLVLEELGVFERCFVEDEVVGERRDDEVDNCPAEPAKVFSRDQADFPARSTDHVIKNRDMHCR